jgi:anti-sigma B factor antagonist
MIPPNAASDLLSVRLVDRDAVTVAQVSGEVDLATRDVLAEALFAQLALAPPGLVIDLTKVGFIGSAGLCVLLEAYKRAQESGIVLRVVADNPPVLKTLQVSGLLEYLPVCPSVPVALSGIHAEAGKPPASVTELC